MLLSNGLRLSKNLPAKFGFSPKPIPTNIAKKLPPQRCSKPFLIPIFNFSHKRPTFAFTNESEHTLGFRRKIAHNGLHGETRGLPSLSHSAVLCRQQNSFSPPCFYIHTFPGSLCPPHYQQREKIRRNCCHKFYPQPLLIPIFNFPHKRPTFAFAGESEYTLGFQRKIAHKGLHGETGGVSDGGGITTLRAFRTFRKPCVARG